MILKMDTRQRHVKWTQTSGDLENGHKTRHVKNICKLQNNPTQTNIQVLIFFLPTKQSKIKQNKNVCVCKNFKCQKTQRQPRP